MDARDDLNAVRNKIRSAILNGELQPGTLMPQGPLAKRFGVSRTPLREALRRLQEEGLIEIERNRRARVASFTLDDQELVYSSRILLSAIATSLTVPRMSNDEIEAMGAAHREMLLAAKANDPEAWRDADRRFHKLHLAHAPSSVLAELNHLFERAALFRILRLKDQPHRQEANSGDHVAILAACQARDVSAAVAAVARHLSRIALTLLAYTAPEREPLTIRAALKLALGERLGT